MNEDNVIGAMYFISAAAKITAHFKQSIDSVSKHKWLNYVINNCYIVLHDFHLKGKFSHYTVASIRYG